MFVSYTYVYYVFVYNTFGMNSLICVWLYAHKDNKISCILYHSIELP